jgi:protein-tyrosine-phosphatase
VKRIAKTKPEPLVAFVCTGNRFRSPLAAARFRELCGPVPFEIASYGTTAYAGSKPMGTAVRAAAELGLVLDSHRPTVLRHGELRGALLVIGFEFQHIAAAVVDGGASQSVTFTLPELCALLDPPIPAEGHTLAERLPAIIEGAHRIRQSERAHHPPAIPDPSTASPRVAAAIAAEIDSLVTRLHAQLAGRRRRESDDGGNAATQIRVV